MSNTERAAFEAWAAKRDHSGDMLWRDAYFPGSYHYGSTQAGWEAWQARAAIAQPAEPGPTMADAVAAGDGTLHGAIDHWQERALKAEKALAAQADAQPVAPDVWTADQIADACIQAEVPDSKYESVMIALHYMPAAAPPARQPQPISLDLIHEWAQRRVKAAGPAGVTDPVAWLEEGVRWGEAQHGIGREGE